VQLVKRLENRPLVQVCQVSGQRVRFKKAGEIHQIQLPKPRRSLLAKIPIVTIRLQAESKRWRITSLHAAVPMEDTQNMTDSTSTHMMTKNSRSFAVFQRVNT
jgi:hypothetical protein